MQARGDPRRRTLASRLPSGASWASDVLRPESCCADRSIRRNPFAADRLLRLFECHPVCLTEYTVSQPSETVKEVFGLDEEVGDVVALATALASAARCIPTS
mgnify:CR=1 FL=1